MTHALTLGMLLCALALTVRDRRPSLNPPTPQTSKAEKAAATFTRAAAEFEYPAPSGRFIIDDGINHGPKRPVYTNCTIIYATYDAQSRTIFDHCLGSQVSDQRFSICVVRDVHDEVKS